MLYLLFVAIDALCIQHSFSSLLKELPDQATHMMEHVLTPSDISDMEQFKSVFRQKAKLLKIILRNRNNACNEFFKTISLCFKMDDLIESMKMKSAHMLKRGIFFLQYIYYYYYYDVPSNFKLINLRYACCEFKIDEFEYESYI